MDERARKRKLQEFEESDVAEVEKELPKQGLKKALDKMKKKQKTATAVEGSEENTIEHAKILKLEQKRLKQERKQQQRAKKNEKKTAKQAEAAERKIDSSAEKTAENLSAKDGVVEGTLDDDEDVAGDEIEHFEIEGLEEPTVEEISASPSPVPSPTFDTAGPSANTSTSSVIPPATAPKHIKLPTDPELLRARLAARIEALRAARKADGLDGAPARNRQELMEARRKKEEQRRAHKKELRLKAKIEEDVRREAALASARDSPASSMLSPLIRSPDQNFSFGRVTFGDGQQLSENLTTVLAAPKRKGPQDAASALQVSEKKRLRIAGLDDEKRADIEEKDLWLNAKKRAHGEKIRDDSSLLKKTLKRKEKAKNKSAKEWGERKEGIAKSQAMKQKKREENLKKRRDEKGSKGKGKGKSGGASKGKKPKVKSRPGFEGSFGSGKRK